MHMERLESFESKKCQRLFSASISENLARKPKCACILYIIYGDWWGRFDEVWTA